MSSNWFSAPAPTAQRVRGYFAPVNRLSQELAIFDVSSQGAFELDIPPAPWVSLGWIQQFSRKALSKTAAVSTGIPAANLEQVRETLSAEVSFEFLSWTKLTMALATGSQHMNLLTTPDSSVTIQTGSTATSIALANNDAARFVPGSMIAIDYDYTGQTGFVGTGIAGGYLRKPLNDVDYVRRVTFNVGLVTEVNNGSLTLATALPGGAPIAGTKLQAITGFVDREGGSFYQEWSGLFVIEGSQRERIYFHYPRLQSLTSAQEIMSPLSGNDSSGQSRVLLKGNYLALPVTDPIDGERILCYRSFVPAPRALV
jgi:hypothetical protein